MTDTIPTPEQLDSLAKRGELTRLHTAMTRGYVSRKSNGMVRRYSGRFGSGFALLTPRWDTSQYCNITYYTA